MSDTIIAVERVTKQVADSTGMLTILHDVDFTLQAQRVGVRRRRLGIGQEHAARRSWPGLDVPTSGTVRLGGIDLFALDEDARAAVRAHKVGFVFQNFQLLANLSALENVMLPLELLGRTDARAPPPRCWAASASASA